MWTAITSAIGGIFGGWVDLKKAKYKAEENRFLAQQKAESDWDIEAMRQAQHSWKDEFIALIWFSPLYVGWFYPEKSIAWIEFVGGLPTWWQFGSFGILAASFGLRWYFKQQNFKVAAPKATQGSE